MVKMANYDAFDAMNKSAGSDMYFSGGAISHSEYEQNMTPDEQKRYEDLLLSEFQMAYNRDPYKRNLDFTHWLKTLNPELYRERALKYDDIRAENHGVHKLAGMDPLEGALLEDAGMIQKLAHLHTGRIEDLMEIVASIAPEGGPAEGGMPPPQQMGPQQQMPPNMAPEAVDEIMDPFGG
jgi:hypothetical protein